MTSDVPSSEITDTSRCRHSVKAFDSLAHALLVGDFDRSTNCKDLLADDDVQVDAQQHVQITAPNGDHPTEERSLSADLFIRPRQPSDLKAELRLTMSDLSFDRMSDVDVEHDDGQSDGDDGHARCRYPRSLSPKTKEQLRLRVNARERERMHDINGAMDALRQVMPYGNGPSVKKLSKMSTLLLARNYILTLTKNLEELKFCVTKVCMEQNKPIPSVACMTPGAGLLVPTLDHVGSVAGVPATRPLSAYQGFPSAVDRAYIYRTTVPCRDTIRHADRPQNEKLSPYELYPTGTTDVTSAAGVRTSLKMKCKSRTGRPCFCVECLTKK